jgi:hypothetical protein
VLRIPAVALVVVAVVLIDIVSSSSSMCSRSTTDVAAVAYKHKHKPMINTMSTAHKACRMQGKAIGTIQNNCMWYTRCIVATQAVAAAGSGPT